MAKIFILIAFLPHLLCTIIQRRNLCSEYFAIAFNPETGKIFGRIEVFAQPENDEIFFLQVALNASVDSMRGTFRLELARSINETIEAIQNGKPLLYHVIMLYHNFPVTVNFPIVSAIWFNYQQYCHGPGGSSGSFVANIALGHMVYPPNKEPLSQDFQSWHRNTSRYRINNPVFYSSTECGVANYDTEGKNKRLIFDETSSPGQWPWIVAVYHVEIEELETTYSFKCGGFLFTNRHVLTAAHCLKMDLLSNDTIDPNRLQVAMGLLSWGKLHGDGTVNRNVTIYKIHPNYEHNTHGDSDVAILTLSDLVEFNPFIKPICLWSGFNLINPVDLINRTGYIVGWGEDSTSFGSIVERQPVPAKIVSQETCLRADRIYRNLISDNTFCAGLLDRQGPCNSGSGLLFLNTLTGRYELRGIVSRSLLTISKTPSCNLGNYVVYVDLVKYVYWIQQQLY